MLEIFESEKHVHLVMELVTGGELFDRIMDLKVGVVVVGSGGVVLGTVVVGVSFWVLELVAGSEFV